MAAKNKKQPKTRRSLKKRTSPEKISPHPIDPARTLAIDMSKTELDDIFLGLHTGQLDNPQTALSKVYLLALDSIENTLLEGISQLCSQIASDAGAVAQDNPLAPWIGQLLHMEPEKLQAFQDSLKTKFDQAKQQLKNSVAQAMSQDAGGENIMGTGSAEYRKALIELLSNPEAKIRLPIAKKQLPDDRLSQIFQDIQAPMPDDGKKRYHFSKMPGTYRFSFGSNATPQNAQTSESPEKSDKSPSPEADLNAPDETPEAEQERIETADIPHEPEADDAESEECELQSENAEVLSVSDTMPGLAVLPEIIASPAEDKPQTPVSVSLSSIPAGYADHPIFQAIAETSLDITKMAREVTDAMTELAIQIGNEAIKAFAEDHLIPKLSESLKDDPRFSQDEELCAFIDTLEDESPELNDSSDESIDNDELAKAFATLFDEFEE